MIPDTWSLDPATLALSALALGLYAQAFTRLRRRGRADHATVRNAALYTTGIALLALAAVSPLDALAEDTLLSAHMVQHLVIGDLAPLLIVLGLRGPMSVFLLPPAVLRPLARSGAVRTLARAMLRPDVAFAAWAVSLGAWHVPQAYDAALAHPAVHLAEHASLLVGGTLLWLQIVDPARRRHHGPGFRAALAGGALLAGMVLSEVLLGSGPLYEHYRDVADRPFGLTWQSDQARAALLMMAEQIATLGPAAALLAWAHVERVAPQVAGEG